MSARRASGARTHTRATTPAPATARVTGGALRARAAREMTEADLTELVRGACHTLGLARYHTLRSVGSEPGWPDEVIVGSRGMLYRELKREKGRLTTAQQEWLDRLAAVGQDVDVWRPEDWFTGRILTELRAIA